jgi:hypothetical protein
VSENVIGTGDTDALAAEYVLGTLDADERTAAKRLLAEDAAFASKVKVWERRLGELHLMVEPVEPESGIWQRIKAKLPEPPPEPPEPPEPVTTVPEPPPEPFLALPEPALEPEPQPQLTPEPEPAPVVESASEEPPLPDPKPASERPLDFWPELERAIIEAKSAPATPESPPQAPDATALPSLPPVTGETPLAAGPEPVEASLGPAPSLVLKPSAGAAVAGVPGAPELPSRPTQVVERDEKRLRLIRRRLSRWRAAAMLMTIAALAIPALLALWKYAPERVPPALQPLQLLRRLGIRIDTSPASRIPAPPESQFDE